MSPSDSLSLCPGGGVEKESLTESSSRSCDLRGLLMKLSSVEPWWGEDGGGGASLAAHQAKVGPRSGLTVPLGAAQQLGSTRDSDVMLSH